MPRGYVSTSTASATFVFFFTPGCLILELYSSEGTFIAYLNEKKVKVRLSRTWVFRCHSPYFPGCNESENHGDYLIEANHRRGIKRQTSK